MDVIVDYWCNRNEQCKEAKRHALLSALDRGDVRYQRLDGKPYEDPVYDLYRRGLILVERESFLEWSGTISKEAEKLLVPVETRDRKPRT